nr:MAG TPA: hypothetical protein [Caudoviricetes sp.]
MSFGGAQNIVRKNYEVVSSRRTSTTKGGYP